MQERNTKRGVLDSEGYGYCFKRQTVGNRKLAEVLKENAQYPWLKGVLEDQTQLRLKRGTRDDNVLAFTMRQQVEAYKDFDYAVHQSNYVPRGRLDSLEVGADTTHLIFCSQANSSKITLRQSTERLWTCR